MRWCGRGDSNPHGIATASPSSWCVCQFRHFRVRVRSGYGGPDKARPPYFFAGAGAALLVGTDGTPGATGAFVGGTVAGVDGCVNGVRPPSTELGLRLPMMPSASAPTMNRIAAIVVARDSTVAPLRAPKADWLLPPPPNALAMSPPLPCCR